MLRQPIPVLLIATLSLGCALTPRSHAADRASDRASPAETAYFKRLEVRLWDAWNRRLDPADAASFYSQDPHNLYFDFTPLKFTGWEEYQRVASKALAGGGHAVTRIHDDFTVYKSGNLAVAAFTFDVSFERPGGGPAQAMNARETDVWVKEGDAWRIVHQHMSTPSRM